MQVKDIMTDTVVFIEPEVSILEAARKMQQCDVGFLPVGRSEKNVTGVLTDRDIVVNAIAQGKDINTVRVKDVMTSGDLVTCFYDDSIEDACSKMQQRQVRRLLVLDDDNNICGVVSMADIAVKTGDRELVYEAIERVSEPSHLK